MSEHNFIDIGRGNAGVRQRVGRNLDHEAFDSLRVEFSKWRVRPPYNAGGHGRSPSIDRMALELILRLVSAISSPDRTWRLCRPSCRTGYPPPGTARSRR